MAGRLPGVVAARSVGHLSAASIALGCTAAIILLVGTVAALEARYRQGQDVAALTLIGGTLCLMLGLAFGIVGTVKSNTHAIIGLCINGAIAATGLAVIVARAG